MFSLWKWCCYVSSAISKLIRLQVLRLCKHLRPPEMGSFILSLKCWCLAADTLQSFAGGVYSIGCPGLLLFSLPPANGRCARSADGAGSLEGSEMLGMAIPLCKPRDAAEVEFELWIKGSIILAFQISISVMQAGDYVILRTAKQLFNCFLSLLHPTSPSLLPLAVVAIRGPTITKKWVVPSVPLSQHLRQDPLTRSYLWTLLPWHRLILRMSY